MTIRQKSSQSMRPSLRKRKTLKRKNKIGKASRSGKKTLKVSLDDQDAGMYIFGPSKSVKRKGYIMDNSYPYTTPPDSFLNKNYTYYERNTNRVILLHSLLEDSPGQCVFNKDGLKEHRELFNKTLTDQTDFPKLIIHYLVDYIIGNVIPPKSSFENSVDIIKKTDFFKDILSDTEKSISTQNVEEITSSQGPEAASVESEAASVESEAAGLERSKETVETTVVKGPPPKEAKTPTIDELVGIIRNNILNEPKKNFEGDLTHLKKFLERILLLWCFRTLIERSFLNQETVSTKSTILDSIIKDWNNISNLHILETQADQLKKDDLNKIFLNLILKKYWTRKNPNNSIQLGLLTDAKKKDKKKTTGSVGPSHLSMFILPESLEAGRLMTVMTIPLTSLDPSNIIKFNGISKNIRIDLAGKLLHRTSSSLGPTTDHSMEVELKDCIPPRTSTFTLTKKTKSNLRGEQLETIASITMPSNDFRLIVSNQNDENEQEESYTEKVTTEDFSKFSIIPKNYQKPVSIDHYLKRDGEPFDRGSQFAKVLSLKKSEIMKMGTKLYKKEKFDKDWLNRQKKDLEAKKKYMEIPQRLFEASIDKLIKFISYLQSLDDQNPIIQSCQDSGDHLEKSIELLNEIFSSQKFEWTVKDEQGNLQCVHINENKIIDIVEFRKVADQAKNYLENYKKEKVGGIFQAEINAEKGKIVQLNKRIQDINEEYFVMKSLNETKTPKAANCFLVMFIPESTSDVDNCSIFIIYKKKDVSSPEVIELTSKENDYLTRPILSDLSNDRKLSRVLEMDVVQLNTGTEQTSSENEQPSSGTEQPSSGTEQPSSGNEQESITQIKVRGGEKEATALTEPFVDNTPGFFICLDKNAYFKTVKTSEKK